MKRLLFALGLALASHAALADTAPATRFAPHAAGTWALQISGTAQHFEQPKNTSRRYNQENWGVGLEYNLQASGSRWTRTYTAGSLKDSLGNWGGYAGVAEEYTLGHFHSIALQPGLGLFTFYRTYTWDGPHHWLVAPVPLLHLEAPNGLGLNIVIAPSIPMHDPNRQMPGFAFFQGTVRF